jgi:multiple antibiotic resistance protein
LQNAPEPVALVAIGAVFTLLFVTLGPIKVLGPFAQLTRDMDEAKMKALAVRAFAIALIAAIVGGFLGAVLVENWQISLAAVTLAGGVIFFLIGLSLVLEQYQPSRAAPPPLQGEPMAAALRLAFPTVVTPYGIAAVIALIANSPDAARTAIIVATLIAVMVTNLLAMLYVRRIIRGITVLVLQILGAVLGVLQVALAVQIMIRGLRLLRVLA